MNNPNNSFWVAWQQASRNSMGLGDFPGGGLYLTSCGQELARSPGAGKLVFSSTPKQLTPESKTFVSTMQRSYCAYPPFFKREQHNSDPQFSQQQPGPSMCLRRLPREHGPHTVDPSLLSSSLLLFTQVLCLTLTRVHINTLHHLIQSHTRLVTEKEFSTLTQSSGERKTTHRYLIHFECDYPFSRNGRHQFCPISQNQIILFNQPTFLSHRALCCPNKQVGST